MRFRIGAALAAAACMLLTALPVSADAATTTYDGMSKDGNYGYYILADGTISVYCENVQLTSAAVPAEIDGYKVSALSIGCFSGCTAVTEVTLPEGLTAIGEKAFFECQALTEVTIPAGVTEIGDYAFDTATALTAIHVDAENPAYTEDAGVLYDKEKETLIKYPEARPDASYSVGSECRRIEDWAFIGSRYLEEIDLGNVTEIGEDAFYYCVTLQEIRIPEGVTELKSNTFGYCSVLEKVSLPSSLTVIGESCFHGCEALSEVKLPEGLQTIGPYAFFECASLTALTLPGSVETLSEYCIGYSYDAAGTGFTAQPDFKIRLNLPAYFSGDSAAQRYAEQMGIACEAQGLGFLLGALGAVIAGLVIAIVVVIRKRK